MSKLSNLLHCLVALGCAGSSDCGQAAANSGPYAGYEPQEDRQVCHQLLGHVSRWSSAAANEGRDLYDISGFTFIAFVRSPVSCFVRPMPEEQIRSCSMKFNRSDVDSSSSLMLARVGGCECSCVSYDGPRFRTSRECAYLP